ncbi:MAG TPA: flagellar export chaperone FliS [Deltaproteobacteria bacterium]|nr:flagellar export chaperone FliS [Deltaproteobacteria bacterium]
MSSVAKYQKVEVTTADPVEMIIKLYEGIVRFNNLSKKAIEEGNVSERNNYINRSIAIISELAASLNAEEGGEVALNLARLYEYSINALNTANIKNDPALIDSVTRVIEELKKGWEGILNNGKDR